jgi:hypothetical protein
MVTLALSIVRPSLHCTFRGIFQRAPSHYRCDKRIRSPSRRCATLGMRPQTFHFVTDPDTCLEQTELRYSGTGQ